MSLTEPTARAVLRAHINGVTGDVPVAPMPWVFLAGVALGACIATAWWWT